MYYFNVKMHMGVLPNAYIHYFIVKIHMGVLQNADTTIFLKKDSLGNLHFVNAEKSDVLVINMRLEH